MDSILEYERKPEEDFYNILIVDELSDVSLDQKINHTCAHFPYFFFSAHHVSSSVLKARD